MANGPGRPIEKPRFLVGLADGGERDRLGARGAVAPRGGRELRRLGRVQRRSHLNAAVAGVGAAAGEHELARHEGMRGMAPAEQDADLRADPVEQHQRGRVARPHRPAAKRKVLGLGSVDLGPRHPLHRHLFPDQSSG